jgi:hypothetical protein
VTCKHCGTEIAANALICFRCGQATTEPSRPGGRAPGASRRGSWPSLAAALILIVAALFMGTTPYTRAPRELSWAVGGLAIVVLAWQVWKRRR